MGGGTEDAEEVLAAEARLGRDHGRHLGHRARHRLGRGRREVPRREGRTGRRRRATSSTAPRRGAPSRVAPNVLAVLLRTDPGPQVRRASGLSLFVVPKESTREHSVRVHAARHGGRLVGKADATPGYRGMHSYTLNFENWFVPKENMVGEAQRRRPRLLPADGGLRGRSSPDRRPRLRPFPGGDRGDGQVRRRPQAVRPSRSPSSSSPSGPSASMVGPERGRPSDHLRRRPRLRRGRARRRPARGPGQAARVRRRGRR